MQGSFNIDIILYLTKNTTTGSTGARAYLIFSDHLLPQINEYVFGCHAQMLLELCVDLYFAVFLVNFCS